MTWAEIWQAWLHPEVNSVVTWPTFCSRCREDRSEDMWKADKLSVADRLGTNPDRIHTDEGHALPRRLKRVARKHAPFPERALAFSGAGLAPRLVAVAMLFLATTAQAASYCGYSSEATAYRPGLTVPLTGRFLGAVISIPVSGLADGSGVPGIAGEGNHRYCGQIAVYFYTGDNPSSTIDFTIETNPAIINPDIAQAKCTAILGVDNDVYYEGYNGDVDWSEYAVIKMRGDYKGIGADGQAHRFVDFHISNGGEGLQPRAAYFASINCPTNLP